jgi:hypothetical protein
MAGCLRSFFRLAYVDHLFMFLVNVWEVLHSS